ncbi:MAG TPA: beta-ketoacyl-ACP synthase III [Acidimicrobiales bacterium]|nr:beta-ketoacyl-ACP synthase III [Acidimicrobiales bacterium]
MSGVRIAGCGAALPPKVVTNADYEATLDTSDRWIVERTGIRERRIGGTTVGLAVEATRAALDCARLGPGDVDLLVLCTSTPEQTMPASATAVCEQLGITGGSFDLNAACAGFTYGLAAGAAMTGGHVRTTVVVGADTMSRITDQGDRTTAVLFADGGGAVVLRAVEGPGELLAWDAGSDGTAHHLLYAELGGPIVMSGREVFRRAVRVTEASIRATLARAQVTPDQVALFVPHQANVRIIEALVERVGLSMARTAVVVDRTGNTSSASIPLALDEAARAGRLAAGDLVLFAGFGSGMSWSSVLVRWS